MLLMMVPFLVTFSSPIHFYSGLERFSRMAFACWIARHLIFRLYFHSLDNWRLFLVKGQETLKPFRLFSRFRSVFQSEELYFVDEVIQLPQNSSIIIIIFDSFRWLSVMTQLLEYCSLVEHKSQKLPSLFQQQI